MTLRQRACRRRVGRVDPRPLHVPQQLLRVERVALRPLEHQVDDRIGRHHGRPEHLPGDGADDGVIDVEAVGNEEVKKRFAQLSEKYAAECKVEGDRVRELGGLYVLGTERHESRRIDNQLRGRSGRQGDPGESRFYLSLEDDLMRWFATGAIEWVMGKGWDDDVPIQAKMVTRAIEKAQNTVEARNGEIRKNVLEYDEVPNEQRKVIYARRDQVLAGGDLRENTVEALATVVDDLLSTHCGSDYTEEWDLEALLADAATYWPTSLEAPALAAGTTSDEVYDLLMADAVAHYESREEEFGADNMRQIERQVMLRVIDARWREHLKELDHLRDGINLRALGQKDPLSEWQRESYDMFGKLIDTIDREYVQYVMHVQVTEQPERPKLSPQRLDYTAPAGPSESTGAPRPAQAAAAAASAASGGVATAEAAGPPTAEANPTGASKAPVVRTEWEKTPRNAPCPCGSGKKYKQCHGAN